MNLQSQTTNLSQSYIRIYFNKSFYTFVFDHTRDISIFLCTITVVQVIAVMIRYLKLPVFM